MKSIIVGITGASGSIYAQALLRHLDQCSDVSRIDLVTSQAGSRVISEELGAEAVRDLTKSDKITVHSPNDIGASIASGSHLSDAMIIVPCSMGSLASIANGLCRDLLHRAADCMLKEHRRLIIVPRETPLNAIHLENMLKLARLGVRIIPAMPSFYHNPQTIDDLVEHFVHRLLDHLDVNHEQKTRWKS